MVRVLQKENPLTSGSGPEATKRSAYYRERAADARVKAEAVRNFEGRQNMLQVAGMWDYRAETAERRSKGRRGDRSTPAYTSVDLEPIATKLRRIAQAARRALENNLAMTHNVDALRHAHGNSQLLLDEKNRDSLPTDIADNLADDVDNLGR